MEKKNKQIELEMKEKNEEILKRWRNLGLLKGLKEGSQNEWRCAKSFELMANFLLENREKLENKIKYHDLALMFSGDIYDIISLLYFSIIRRLICIERPRVNRIIQPEEIHDEFTTVTLKEATDILYNNGITKKKKISKKGEYALKIKDYYDLDNMTFIAALDKSKRKNDLKMLRQVFNIDIEAEIIVLFSKYMAVKLNNERNG